MTQNDYITEHLLSLKDETYREFHSRLMPTVPVERIIGVRVPLVRAFAKDIAKTQYAEPFLMSLPHYYYEQNNLHAFIIEQIKDYNKCILAIDNFLPYIDNWTTCDLMRPKVFAKNTDKLINKIEEWLSSNHTYTVRFGIEMLMSFYLDNNFFPCYCNMVANIKSEEYYVNMMIAWYFATALAKQWNAALPYITQQRLSVWVHNKTIQKAVESYRITPQQKDLLKALRIKQKNRQKII